MLNWCRIFSISSMMCSDCKNLLVQVPDFLGVDFFLAFLGASKKLMNLPAKKMTPVAVSLLTRSSMRALRR